MDWLSSFDRLDISDIVNGSTLTVDFKIKPTLTDAEPIIDAVRYQVRYFDAYGNLLDGVHFLSVPNSDWFTDAKLDLQIDKPAGAVSMTFIAQFMDIYSEQLPCSFSVDLESVNFSVTSLRWLEFSRKLAGRISC